MIIERSGLGRSISLRIKGILNSEKHSLTKDQIFLPALEPTAAINKFSDHDRDYLETTSRKIYPIERKSLEQMLAEDSELGKEYFGHVNLYEPLRNFLPIPRQVAINPNELVITNSNGLTFDELIELVRSINLNLWQEGIRNAEAFMPDVSTLCQLDRIRQEETGEKLIVGLYACTTTETVGSQVSAVGRLNPNGKLVVVSCSRDLGNKYVGALLVIAPKIES